MKFIKATLLGGLFFLVPVILLIIIGGKALGLIERLLQPILSRFKDSSVAGVALQQIIAIVILLFFCFLAGLFSRTKIARRIVGWIENSILSHLPGYRFMKSLGQTVTGMEEKNMDVVLVRVDDGWQIAFLIEKVNENLFTVFVPDAPSPWSGAVYYVDQDRLKQTDMTQQQAMNCIRQLGFGSAGLIKKEFETAAPTA